MSLITEEVPPGLLYVPKSPQPLSTSQQGDFDPPETATAGLSPQRQAGGQKASTVTGNVCAVCSEMAPKETVFRKHYGVVCCEACKCFFRRTVQMNRDYKCRYDGRCTIGRFPESMKQVCQACRFSQCIRSGMKMECESALSPALFLSLSPLPLPPSLPPFLSPLPSLSPPPPPPSLSHTHSLSSFPFSVFCTCAGVSFGYSTSCTVPCTLSSAVVVLRPWWLLIPVPIPIFGTENSWSCSWG